MFTKSTKTISAAAVLIFAVYAVGFYFWKDTAEQKIASQIAAFQQTKSSQPIQSKAGTAVIKPIKIAVRPKAPDLNKPIVVTASLDEVAKQKALAQIADLVKVLKQDSESYNSWINLGIYRKFIGDYVGAAEAWQYAAVLDPNASVPMNNLADLYTYSIKNNILAEQYFLKAIDKEPKQIRYYYNAYEFYRFVTKDLDKAKAILKRGIAVADPANVQALEDLLKEF